MAVDREKLRILTKQVDQLYRTDQISDARAILNNLRNTGRADYMITILASIDHPQAQSDLAVFRSRPQYKDVQPLQLKASPDPIMVISLVALIIAIAVIGLFAINSAASSAVTISAAAPSISLNGSYAHTSPDGVSVRVQFPEGWVAKDYQSMIRFASDTATLERIETDPLLEAQTEGIVAIIPKSALPAGGDVAAAIAMVAQGASLNGEPVALTINNHPAYMVSATTNSIMAAGPAIDANNYRLAAAFIMIDLGDYVAAVTMAAPQGRMDLIDPLIHAVAASVQLDPTGKPLTVPSAAA